MRLIRWLVNLFRCEDCDRPDRQSSWEHKLASFPRRLDRLLDIDRGDNPIAREIPYREERR